MPYRPPENETESRKLDRRDFVKASLLPAALALPAARAWAAQGANAPAAAGGQPTPSAAAGTGPEIIDSNVHLFDWPFRRLKYSQTDALMAKLRRHRITRAWAGSFDCVLHRQLDQANRRLAEECKSHGGGMLIPFGGVNPAWPDWEEDVRRCHEQYKMPGIRLYPAYHGYTLAHPEFVRLLEVAARRNLLVQVAFRLEDERVHHTLIDAPPVDAAPLAEMLKKVPQARVQLINASPVFRSRHLRPLSELPQVTFDIADVESNGGVGRLIEGTNFSYRGTVPVERLLFGSHVPFFPCESAVFKLFESPLTLDQLEKIMHANARRLVS